MDYKQYNLEELQGMFDKEQNPEELNKIMNVIVDKQGILSEDYKEANNAVRRTNLPTNELNQVRRS